MNKKFGPLILLCLLAAITWFVQRNNEKSNGATVLNRNPEELIFTKHARCRMGCRFFTEGEVREILKNGKINQQKSRPNDTPCPSYALEGVTSDGQEARMVFATCDNTTIKVVTCIDLKTDYKCDCY